jgi:PHD/YefM family antitoxin component YafN of YafNO toxin-antitoxin module
MKMILAKDVVSLTDFARQTRKHTTELNKTNRPRLLTHNGKATAVVLSVAAYDEMAQAAEEYLLDVQLREALEAYDRGDRGRPLDEAFVDLRTRLFKGKPKK